jgi:protein-disulfide isomerase
MKRETTLNDHGPKHTLPLNKRDHIQGSIEAPLKLLEYADFECPYCGEAFQSLLVVREQLGDQLCLAFRHFPLADVHPHAERAAEAAEAAGAQNRFWEMHDLLFENQDALDNDNLVEYARTIGLNISRFVRELEAGTHLARVREDFVSGVKSGVGGTPTFFINGLRHEGEYDPDTLIDALTQTAAAH